MVNQFDVYWVDLNPTVGPKNETIANIARLNREMLKAKIAD